MKHRCPCVLAALLLPSPHPDAIAQVEVPKSFGVTAPNSEATAEAPGPSVVPPQRHTGPPWETPYGERRLALGVTEGYGWPTTTIDDFELDPYRANFGLTLSYTFDLGVWLGVFGRYYTGGTVEQVYEPIYTPYRVPVAADSRMTALGASVGYDQKLGPIVLRYALDVGVSLLEWKFVTGGRIRFRKLAGFPSMQGSLTGFHIAPGLGLVWPIDWWFAGLEFRYRVEAAAQLPQGAETFLHAGVRLP